MKTVFKFFYATLILMIFTGCSTENLDEVSQDTDIFARSSNSNQDIIARASGDVVGFATLHRKKDRVTTNIHTSGLTPGDAYTVWFIIFEAPDVFVDALYATGGVVGDDGVANFKATLSEGDVSGSIATGVGLTDAEHQGVHMIIRSHGLAIPGMVDEQINTVGGGCGINVCVDEQAVIFFPL